MNRDVQKKFISVLIDQTRANVISWRKESNLAYSAQVEAIRLLADKYFSKLNEQLISCVNLTLFDTDDQIIDEMVACTTTDPIHEYELLNTLYKEIELVTKESEDQQKNAIIAHLTQSIRGLKVS